MKKVKLPKIKCFVSNLYNKNQFVIEVNKYYVFQSYKSEIAIYNRETKDLFINDYYIGYSKTTSKHLYIFINEYTRHSVHNINELKTFIKEGSIKTYKR